MKSVFHKYFYILYRGIYWAKDNKEAAAAAAAILIIGFLYFNAIVLVTELNVKFLNNKGLLISLMVIFCFINLFYFLRHKRYLKIEEEYKLIPRRKKYFWLILMLFYFILSISSIFI